MLMSPQQEPEHVRQSSQLQAYKTMTELTHTHGLCLLMNVVSLGLLTQTMMFGSMIFISIQIRVRFQADLKTKDSLLGYSVGYRSLLLLNIIYIFII